MWSHNSLFLRNNTADQKIADHFLPQLESGTSRDLNAVEGQNAIDLSESESSNGCEICRDLERCRWHSTSGIVADLSGQWNWYDGRQSIILHVFNMVAMLDLQGVHLVVRHCRKNKLGNRSKDVAKNSYETKVHTNSLKKLWC
jgi:hypothetical protein